MSEPQGQPVEQLMKPTSTPENQFVTGDPNAIPSPAPEQIESNATTPTPTTQPATTATAPPPPTAAPVETQPELSGPVKTLKDAFPDIDTEVIETILDSQGGNLDAAFEVLLGMSDPSYKPEPEEVQRSNNQLRQDEEYARRLAREGDAHYPQQQQVNSQEQQQPLFNFQEIAEELPIIKEKVIEVGTAAKNKIMDLYNQFMAGPSDQQQQQQQQQQQPGVLETGMGNLSLSDSQQQPKRQAPPANVARGGSVDLYEWDGKAEGNPLLAQKKEPKTSTPTDQMASDEEFARQLAREDAEASAIAHSPGVAQNLTTTATNLPNTNINNKTTTESDSGEVSLSALNDESAKKTEPLAKPSSGYTHTDDDDLDDLFDKQDSNIDLTLEDHKEEPKK